MNTSVKKFDIPAEIRNEELLFDVPILTKWNEVKISFKNNFLKLISS